MFKLCPNCGAHNAPTANFCTKCGANLAGVAATQPQAPATPDTTNGEADTVSATSQSPVATAPTADAKSGAAPETTKPISTQTTQAELLKLIEKLTADLANRDDLSWPEGKQFDDMRAWAERFHHGHHGPRRGYPGSFGAGGPHGFDRHF